MQQSEGVRDILVNGKKSFCESHPEQHLQVIYFGDKNIKKSRFLCQKCIIEGTEVLKNLNVFAVPIQKFLDQPDIIVDNVLSFKSNEQLIEETEIINNLQKNIDGFADILKEQVQVMRQNISQIYTKSQIARVKNEFMSKVNINDISLGMHNVLQTDSYNQTKEFQSLEINLDNLAQQLSQIKVDDILNNQRYLINQLHQKYKIDVISSFQLIQNGIDQLARDIMNQLSSITPAGIPDSVYDDIKDFPHIHELISDGKKIEYKLLFQGSKVGYNATLFWAICNLQSNLLTIMQSQNGNKFGGYSPCTINKSLNKFVEDPTMKSFLFQYNKKEIYKLKHPNQAIGCFSQYGLIFGGGHDINIAADFNGGYSKLGHSYDISNYNILDKATHMFGSKTPQLKDIKVYQVIFQ